MAGGAEGDQEVSALVILRTEATAPAVIDHFRSAGFETGPLVAKSFAISGPPERFDAAFGDEAGQVIAGDGSHLPLRALPPGLVTQVEAVSIADPPDFGRTAG